MPAARRRRKQLATAPTPATAALEYARNLHAQVLESNQTLFTRAQIVLTLDGVIVAAYATVVAAKANELKPLRGVLAGATWTTAGLAVTALVISVAASVTALFSKHGAGPKASGFSAENMWFYRCIADLVANETPGGIIRAVQGPHAHPMKSEEFAREAKRQAKSPAFETEARLLQVAITAPMMVRRASSLNCAFISTALALSFSVLAVALYIAAPRRAPSPTPPPDRIASIELTPKGRVALRDTLGRECHVDDLSAVILSTLGGEPTVLTLPRRGCRSATLRVTPELGSVR